MWYLRKFTKINCRCERLLAIDSVGACRTGSRWGDACVMVEEEGDKGPSEENTAVLGN